MKLCDVLLQQIFEKEDGEEAKQKLVSELLLCFVMWVIKVWLFCLASTWCGSKYEKSDENAADEATSNLGTATLGATTVQKDDVGFVTVLPGAENATWLDLPFLLNEQDQQGQIQETKTTNNFGDNFVFYELRRKTSLKTLGV